MKERNAERLSDVCKQPFHAMAELSLEMSHNVSVHEFSSVDIHHLEFQTLTHSERITTHVESWHLVAI